MIPITVVAGPPAPVDFLEAFKHKLSLFGINRPHASTISRLLHFHPQHMFKMAQSSASENDTLMLYRQVLAQPGSQTALQMRSQLDVAINGPLLERHPFLVSAVDLKSSSLLVLKLLPPLSPEAQQAAQAERHAIDVLALSTLPTECALVKCSLVNISVSKEHAKSMEIGEGDYDAVNMPRYAASLSQLPQLPTTIIYRGALRVESALMQMHAASILHADVKSANVLLNTADMWHLADFGSCVEFGKPVISCTEVVCPPEM